MKKLPRDVTDSFVASSTELQIAWPDDLGSQGSVACLDCSEVFPAFQRQWDASIPHLHKLRVGGFSLLQLISAAKATPRSEYRRREGHRCRYDLRQQQAKDNLAVVMIIEVISKRATIPESFISKPNVHEPSDSGNLGRKLSSEIRHKQARNRMSLQHLRSQKK
jgi:hypothetical protein